MCCRVEMHGRVELSPQQRPREMRDPEVPESCHDRVRRVDQADVLRDRETKLLARLRRRAS